MTSVPITKARAHLPDLFNAVLHRREVVVITRHEKEEVVMISRQEWEHLKALAEVADARAADKALAEGGRDIALDEIRRELGL